MTIVNVRQGTEGAVKVDARPASGTGVTRSGPRGRGWSFGIGAPLDIEGADGDMYYSTDGHVAYGPKAGGTWDGVPTVDFKADADMALMAQAAAEAAALLAEGYADQTADDRTQTGADRAVVLSAVSTAVSSSESAEADAALASAKAAEAIQKAGEAANSAVNAASSASGASGSAIAAATSETNAASSEANSDNAATIATQAASETSADAALTAADRAQTGQDKVSTAADRVQTGLDRVATAADRVQTGLDKTAATTAKDTAVTQAGIATTKAGEAAGSASTATTQAGIATTKAGAADASADAAADDAVQTTADRVQTGIDRAAIEGDATATAADRLQTGLDRTATNVNVIATAADREATGQDKVATAADRIQTGLDRTATGQDASSTAADRVATGQDADATGADRVATAADRVQTGLDRTAAEQAALNAATFDPDNYYDKLEADGRFAPFGAQSDQWTDISGGISYGGIVKVGGFITTAATALTLEQTGDTYGTTRLHLQSRNGSAGAMFESPGLDLFDFGFKGSSGYQSNIRYEHRSDQIRGGADTSVGEFQFIDDPIAGGNWFFTTNRNATVVHAGNLGVGVPNPSEKLSVAGNIAVTGNVDGRDLSADGAKLDGIAAGAEVNVNADWNAGSGDAQILNKPTLGTAAATDSTAYATAAQGAKANAAVQPSVLDAAIAALIDSAPGAIDTLNELAAALGDDPNFAATVTNALAGKAASVHTHTVAELSDATVNARSLLQAANYATMFGLLKQAATSAATGVVELATNAEVRSSATGNKALTAQMIEEAVSIVTLTDATTIAVDWDAFIKAQVTMGGNRTLGNPTNVQTGTNRYITVKGSDATARTISFGSNFKGDLPTGTVTSTSWLLIGLHAETATHIIVTSCKAL